MEREDVHPDWAAELLLPQCDIAIITGTTVINKSIDHLLSLCRGEIAIAGPTTPLSTVFANYGVSYLFGMKSRDADKVLKIISEGGGTRRLGSAVSKVALRLNLLIAD
ncbi:MAG: Rossmann-like domain-containing protein [Candidatus Bipolaricaulia bacterium]